MIACLDWLPAVESDRRESPYGDGEMVVNGGMGRWFISTNHALVQTSHLQADSISDTQPQRPA